MSAERELLDLAAKAAGIEVWTDIDGNLYTDTTIGAEVRWNPLDDDGDALRLAVKLGIDITQAVYMQTDANQGYEDPPYELTRRAIVVEAAEMGRQA